MFTDFATALRPSLVMTALFAILLGLAYPAAITAVAQLAFPWQANGSLLITHDRVIGSDLIGQNFASDRYFHGRLSAAGAGYDATASGGSNLGPASQTLHDRVAAALKASPSAPADLVTTSASGLDPHINPEAALYQVPRIAHARGLPDAQVRALVANQTEGAWLGLLGEPRVNVLRLNIALDAATHHRAISPP